MRTLLRAGAAFVPALTTALTIFACVGVRNNEPSTGSARRVADAWYRPAMGGCVKIDRTDEAVYELAEIAPAELVEGTPTYP
jgi:hypothetical protein